MRILQITPSYKPAYVYGGPIESVSKLCEGLVYAGHSVDVYTTTANGATELEVISNRCVVVDNVNVTYFTRITKDHTHVSTALWNRLYRTCRTYDVVHIHSWWNILVIIAAIICHQRKVKVIISPRGMLSDYILTATNAKVKKLIHSIAGRRVLRQSYFHATSQTEYEECRKLIPGWKGFILPNILTLPDLPVRKTKNEVFSLLFLSRIHPKKGIEFLLEAISRIKENVVLKIAGSGDENYIASLKQKIALLGIENRIIWLGWQDRSEKFKELMAADLFVLISYNENFANSVVESLHVGTPVLLSNRVGLANFVAQNNVGWITEPNVDKVSEALLTILGQPDKLNWIQNNGQRIIDSFFSEQTLIQQYAEYYKMIADDHFQDMSYEVGQ